MGDAANGLRFGASTNVNDSINIISYLHGDYNDADYDLQDGDDGSTLFGKYSAKSQISLKDIADLGKIRIIRDSNNEGLNAGTTAYLYMHPNVSTALATQGETVNATLTWTLHQDASQF
jgi:hypothetical protein